MKLNSSTGWPIKPQPNVWKPNERKLKLEEFILGPITSSQQVFPTRILTMKRARYVREYNIIGSMSRLGGVTNIDRD
ncbi:hypothetical protein BGZ63DRAFT_387513 [Mariannaea sp. PMI_226]|nr:hypothetical protein BGZ63DRAFT_387513 [Mariannaea sp. PMI_226]